MALILNKSVPVFDTDAIKRGDAIRIRRATDTTFRNGIVTRIDPGQIQILVSNVQNNATSFVHLEAGDVNIGVWEIWWTTDFVTTNYSPPAGGSENA
jgi:hypothetical protein